MFSGTHYGIKVDMGWLKDDVDGLKQVVDFLNNNSDYLQKARKYGHFTGYKN